MLSEPAQLTRRTERGAPTATGIRSALQLIRRRCARIVYAARGLEYPASILTVGREDDDRLYRTPTELEATQAPISRVLLIGACQMSHLVLTTKLFDATRRAAGATEVDHFLFNNYARLPDVPPRAASEYDFQAISIPLRNVVPDETFSRLSFDDLAGFERVFEESCSRLHVLFDETMRWSRQYGMLTFVANFLEPQQNSMGRLLPRNDLRNFANFVARLNDVLDDWVRECPNAYTFDINSIAANFGRRYFQDDVLWGANHGDFLTDFDYVHDHDRLQPQPAATSQYALNIAEFHAAWWLELRAMFRTARQVDQVKLVILDLDDTLWRGIPAETGAASFATQEGWPHGLVEALAVLKKRGVLLAIASKNERSRIESIWRQLVGDRLSLDDFAAVEINWRSKVENISAIIRVLNVTPNSVVFIDDNPVERAAIRTSFPGVRVLGDDLYSLRRILLWSAETQTATITAESSRRTEMIQSQIKREAFRSSVSREEFLSDIDVRLKAFAIADTGDRRFARVIELINKTNQFNTTGRRWSTADAVAFMRQGGVFHAFEVVDRFTNYGLACVVILSAEGRIEQVVMSCRVAGLDVELAAVYEVCRAREQRGKHDVSAILVETEANLPVRDLFQRCGMTPSGDGVFSAQTGSLTTGAARVV